MAPPRSRPALPESLKESRPRAARPETKKPSPKQVKTADARPQPREQNASKSKEEDEDRSAPDNKKTNSQIEKGQGTKTSTTGNIQSISTAPMLGKKTHEAGSRSSTQSTPRNTIFGLTRSQYNVPLLRRILAIFRQKLKKNEARADLLDRLVKLEGGLPSLKVHAVAQLLERDLDITRLAINNWPDLISEETTKAQGKERQCDACLDFLAASEFRRDPATTDCKHECTICDGCLTAAVGAQLDDAEQDWGAVRSPSCDCILQPQTIRRYIISQDVLTKYNAYIVNLHLDHITLGKGLTFRWCIKPGCRHGSVCMDTHTDDRKITCEGCEFESCRVHLLPWNEGEGDKDHNSRTCVSMVLDAKSEAKIRATTRACPNCNVRIEKWAGCLHMQCAACDTSFYWDAAV